MEQLRAFFNYSFSLGKESSLSVKEIIFLILTLVLTNLLLRLIRKLVNRRLEKEDKGKFKAIFTFLKYFIYVAVIIIALESHGVEVGVLLAGSAALLVGIGLGLQTLFQDIISGIFILLDKSLHVNDIIEIDGKVGKVFDIKLRTTRAVTVDDRVIVIPNHKFLTHSLYNWTQNGTVTTEVINIGVAYGSDVELVKRLLIESAEEHTEVLKSKKPSVLFIDFGDSALQFRLVFDINDSFSQLRIKSDLRYVISKKFNENGVNIPFPQRDIHIKQK